MESTNNLKKPENVDPYDFKQWQTDYTNRKIILRPARTSLKIDVDLNDSRGSGGSIRLRQISTTTTDATPTVRNANLVDLTGTTTITDFDNGVIGQVLYIKANDGITITNGAPIKLAGAVNYVMTAEDTLILTMFDDQVWHELGRSVN